MSRLLDNQASGSYAGYLTVAVDHPDHGLLDSRAVWAFAKAVAMAATLSLERCMAYLYLDKIKLIAPDFDRLARMPWVDLSKASKTATKNIPEFERAARAPYSRTLEDVRGALETAGVEFIAQTGGRPGVRLRNAQQ